MPVITQGHLNFSSFMVRSTAQLDQLIGQSLERPYGGVPSSGWGGTKSGGEELLGRITRLRSAEGAPLVKQDDAAYPDQFQGRLYFDQLDKRLQQAADHDDAPSRYYRFEAADVLISPTSEDDEYLVVASTRSTAQVNSYIVPAVRDLFEGATSESQLSLDRSTLAIDEDDLFRWLLYRASFNPVISSTLSIISVDSISGMDIQLRGSAFSKGAALDRPELLTQIAMSATAFGPAKVQFRENALSLDILIELRRDGAFSIFRGRSQYDEDVDVHPSDVGLSLVRDAIFEVIPEVKRCYNADSAWNSKNRADFAQYAVTALNSVDYK